MNPILIVTPHKPDPAIVLIVVPTAEDAAAAPEAEVAAVDVVVAVGITGAVGMVDPRVTKA